jgi:hypothetical protein
VTVPGAVKVVGIEEATAALKAIAVRLDLATAQGAEASRDLVETRARNNLGRYSHKRGTPTPSPKGEPPAKIDGTLQDAFKNTMPVPDGIGGWVCTLSSGLVYSRIQELGGWAGRNHASYLPPRPYLKPAAMDLVASGDLQATFARFWADAICA